MKSESIDKIRPKCSNLACRDQRLLFVKKVWKCILCDGEVPVSDEHLEFINNKQDTLKTELLLNIPARKQAILLDAVTGQKTHIKLEQLPDNGILYYDKIQYYYHGVSEGVAFYSTVKFNDADLNNLEEKR